MIKNITVTKDKPNGNDRAGKMKVSMLVGIAIEFTMSNL
jgi:hypothetical protein